MATRQRVIDELVEKAGVATLAEIALQDHNGQHVYYPSGLFDELHAEFPKIPIGFLWDYLEAFRQGDFESYKRDKWCLAVYKSLARRN